MSNKSYDFSEILDILINKQDTFDAATVYGLTSLAGDRRKQLAENWLQIPVHRRRRLIQHLNTVSESDFEMDFHAVNHIGLADEDSEVRQYAIEGLWEDESLTLLHKLIDIVRHDTSMDVRIAAVSELGRFILLGEYEDIPHADALLAQNTVLEVLNSDADTDLRRRALESIANCSRSGVREMIEDFYAQGDLQMRISAVFAMGRTCDEDWAPEVIDELRSETPELQYEAARAAGNIQLVEAVPHIVQLIEETDDTEILEVAIWALGEIGGEEARRTLQQIAEQAEADDNEELLAAAQDALDAAGLPGDFLLFDFEP